MRLMSLCFIMFADSRDFASYMHNSGINMRCATFGCPCTRFAWEILVKCPYICKKMKMPFKNGKKILVPKSHVIKIPCCLV